MITAAHLRVNPIACKAHGVCIEMLAELIGRDPWGYPVIADRPISPDLLGLAKRAIDAVPRLPYCSPKPQPGGAEA